MKTLLQQDHLEESIMTPQQANLDFIMEDGLMYKQAVMVIQPMNYLELVLQMEQQEFNLMVLMEPLIMY